jgi:hypothetical protein
MCSQSGQRGPTPLQWLRGLNTAVSGNAQAFGFSITITATYGVVSSAQGSASLPEIFGFALAASRHSPC